ncbi:MAG: glutamine synthetase family protein [Reichenbachiella sp.]
MEEYNVQTKEEILKRYTSEGIKYIKLGFVDIDGVIRGKYISLEKFTSILDTHAGFCDCVLGWDIDDQLYDNTSFTGWHTAYPDALFQIDLTSERMLNEKHPTPFFLVDFVTKDQKEKEYSLHPISPRTVLKKVIEKAHSMNIGVTTGFEYEFFVFNETSHSIREKNYTNLTPLTMGNFGYSVLRNSTESDLFHDLLEYTEKLNIPIEGLHCETGPGVIEAAIHYADVLKSCDDAVLFKTFSKVFFQQRNLIATFMAKWSMEHPGQSGHIHQSLYDLETGEHLFYNPNAYHNISDTLRYYIGGQQRYLKELLPLTTPTINAYTRLVKGAWAPTSLTWGIENRTTALRVIPDKSSAQRLEFRIGSADANPFLAAAAIIAAGLQGIEEKRDPTEAITGNAYEQEANLESHLELPTNLRDATSLFKKSEIAPTLFGLDFCEHYTATREWEVREYEKQVTDWQLKRYFEGI